MKERVLDVAQFEDGAGRTRFPAYRLTLWNREASPSAVRSLLAQPGVRVLSTDGKVYAFLRPA